MTIREVETMSTAIIVLVVLYFVGAHNIMRLVKALKSCSNSVINELVEETTKELQTK